MSKKIDLSIIILNYNTSALLKECLLSIKKAKRNGLVFETIVVDNASTDESVKMLKENFPQVSLLRLTRNLGFAKGNNLGIKNSRGKFVLLLNPDTKVFPETLKVMVDYLVKNPDVAIATCRVELVNGELDDACHRGFPTPSRAFFHFVGLGKIFPKNTFFNGYHLGYQSLGKIHEIDSCVGAFMMIRRKIGEALGWLDEDFFWYGEDLDFCYRAKKAGWKVMFVPKTKIIHWKGASSGIKKASQKVSTASLATKRKAVQASVEAMRIFYRKHYLHQYPKIITWLAFLAINLLEKARMAKL